jgi:hypothetical protein
MRVQGTNTVVSGPVGVLPVPVPLREDGPFADTVANANRANPPGPPTRDGPLATLTTPPDTPPTIPCLDAVRAYARASRAAEHRQATTTLSLHA